MVLDNLPQSTPGTPAAKSRAYVVYGGKTGAILHVHYTVEFDGGAPQTEGPRDRALRMAGAAADPSADAQVIELDPAAVNHRRPIRIDLATRRVVAV